MAVTAALVKQLRETSGAGMMDCKKALEETSGDIDAAIDWLRTKGLATAAKKSGRVAAEGLVAINVAGTSAAMIELNAETDFVSRNDDFQSLALNLAKLANNASDISQSYVGGHLRGGYTPPWGPQKSVTAGGGIPPPMAKPF